jgi:hypothetical protein
MRYMIKDNFGQYWQLPALLNEATFADYQYFATPANIIDIVNRKPDESDDSTFIEKQVRKLQFIDFIVSCLMLRIMERV